MEKLVSTIKIYGKRFHIHKMPETTTGNGHNHVIVDFYFDYQTSTLWAILETGEICTTAKHLTLMMENSRYRSLPRDVIRAFVVLKVISPEDEDRLIKEEDLIGEIQHELDEIESVEAAINLRKLEMTSASSDSLIRVKIFLNKQLAELINSIEGNVTEAVIEKNS